MAFRAPAPLKSMDLQYGQWEEKSPTGARIISLLQLSPHWLRQDRRDLERPSRRPGGHPFAGRSRRGSLRVLLPLVREFSRRVPTISLVLSHAQPGAGVASAVFCSSVSYSFGSSTTAQIVASVVSMSEAMEAAFCRAVRVTLVGSITPASTRSSYCSVEALKPWLGFWWFLIL